jgi:hypothetical protein
MKLLKIPPCPNCGSESFMAVTPGTLYCIHCSDINKCCSCSRWNINKEIIINEWKWNLNVRIDKDFLINKLKDK